MQLGYVQDWTVANYARLVCALNLQKLSDILRRDSTWAFALANDASTHYGKSYFDNRVRFHLDGIIHNYHVLAIPIFDRHTGENMFNLISRLLDIICPDWRTKLIAVGSDGANSMTGRLQGVVTRLEEAAMFKIYRTWCGLHQLDLAMYYAYDEVWTGKFLDDMHRFIGYLRAQVSRILRRADITSKIS